MVFRPFIIRSFELWMSAKSDDVRLRYVIRVTNLADELSDDPILILIRKADD